MIRGLILTGGKSRRYGTDKYLAQFHDLPQYQYIAGQFEKLQIPYFFSCSRQQSGEFRRGQFVTDRYADCGPIGGLLSGLEAYPKDTMMVIACDLPNINDAAISELIGQRDPKSDATVYASISGRYEPAFALYEPSARDILDHQMRQNDFSLQKALGKMKLHQLQPPNKELFLNINTAKEFDQYRTRIASRIKKV